MDDKTREALEHLIEDSEADLERSMTNLDLQGAKEAIDEANLYSLKLQWLDSDEGKNDG